MRRIALLAAAAFALDNGALPYDEKTHVHLVYSTGCTQKHRQFLTASLQMSLIRVGHVGPLTEIVSGCDDAAKLRISSEPSFYDDYRLHFTKDYALYTSPNFTDHYNPYNKPFGLRDFFHNSTHHDQLAVAFIDADYMLFKPLRINLGQKWGKYYQKSTMRKEEDITDTVVDGIALAQNMRAFLGMRWFNDYNRTYLNLVCEGLPCKNVTTVDAFEYFEPAGTPYIQTRSDWLRVVEDYCNFAVQGRTSQQNDWMVEMYAYGAAVANQNVKHTLLKHLGPASPEYQTTEYWDFIDKEKMDNPCADPFTVTLPEDPPIGIHYFMYYGVPDNIDEGFMYYKYRIPEDIMECDSQMFKLPPKTEWTDIETIYADKPEKIAWKRHSVWLECTLLKYGNEVLRKIKEKTCPHGFNTHQGIVLHAKDTPLTPHST